MFVSRPRAPLFGLAALAPFGAPAPARASRPGTGMTVVTDPAGEGEGSALDVVGILMAEIFAGTHAGKILITVELASTGPPGPDASGWWLVSWRQAGGGATVELNVIRCGSEVSASYTCQSADGEYVESGAVDAVSFTADGQLQVVLGRDKFQAPRGSRVSGRSSSAVPRMPEGPERALRQTLGTRPP